MEIFNLWLSPILPIELSNFSLLHQNLKYIYNATRYKFSNTSNECRFCCIFPSTNTIPSESFSHIFFNCKYTTNITSKCITDLTNLNLDFKSLITHGSQLDYKSNLVLNIETTLLCFFIHRSLKNSKIPTFQAFLQMSFGLKKNMLRHSAKYNNAYFEFCKKFGKNINSHNKWLLFVT